MSQLDRDTFLRWRALNVYPAQRLWTRWKQKKGPSHRDPLIELQQEDDVDPRTPRERGGWPISTWRVTSELLLIRLIGALQHVNPRLQLWFRGSTQAGRDECDHFIVPRRGRPGHSGAAGEARLREQLDALEMCSLQHRLVRNRSPLARLALVQHYGGATSMLDVTSDLRTALYFASLRTELRPLRPATEAVESRWIQVFAAPRTIESVNDFPNVGICVVDLSAEMPSYCLRPHAQHAGFLAWRDAARIDLACNGQDHGFLTPAARQLGGPGPVELDMACLACIRLEFAPEGLDSLASLVFPPASTSCVSCSAGADAVDDYSADTALHVLKCSNLPHGLPDFHWVDSAPGARAG